MRWWTGIMIIGIVFLIDIALLAALIYSFWYCWPLAVILGLLIYTAWKKTDGFGKHWKPKNIKRFLEQWIGAKPPSKEGLRNARERFSKARNILENARRELDFDPPVDWTPELDKENEDEKDA